MSEQPNRTPGDFEFFIPVQTEAGEFAVQNAHFHQNPDGTYSGGIVPADEGHVGGPGGPRELYMSSEACVMDMPRLTGKIAMLGGTIVSGTAEVTALPNTQKLTAFQRLRRCLALIPMCVDVAELRQALKADLIIGSAVEIMGNTKVSGTGVLVGTEVRLRDREVALHGGITKLRKLK